MTAGAAMPFTSRLRTRPTATMLMPLIIIDTTSRADLTEVIEAQAHLPMGDVIIQWGTLPKRLDCIALLLKFQRPIERAVLIAFDIAKQGILVEQILQTKGLYIQAGKPGDRLKHDLNGSKMLIEVPDTGIRPYWDKLFFHSVVKSMRRGGLGRRDAREAARAVRRREIGREIGDRPLFRDFAINVQTWSAFSAPDLILSVRGLAQRAGLAPRRMAARRVCFAADPSRRHRCRARILLLRMRTRAGKTSGHDQNFGNGVADT